MRIASGVTDQYVYFVAVDATDFTTRETGLSSFTVYRSRNGAAAAAMTTPTINETDTTNMPGVYELLLDEDMTIGAGNLTEAMTFHITHAGMAPVTIEVELFDPNNYTVGTATNLTNLPSIPANWITAAGITASALDGKGDWNIGKTGYALSAAGVDAIWDETMTEHVTADSAAVHLKDIVADTNELQGDWVDGGRLDLILDARASQTTADAIETDTQDIQARLPAALVAGRMSSDAAAISGSTVAADNVEANIGNLDAAVTTRSSHSAADVWTAGTRTLTSLKDVAKASGLILTEANIDTVTSQTQFVIPVTDDAPDADAYNGHVAVIIDQTDLNQRSVRVVTDYDQTTRTVTVDRAPEFTVAVNDDIVILPSINVAIPELAQAAPAAEPTLLNAVMLLYMALRNQTIVTTSGADELQISNDAGTVIATKALTDVTGDYTEAKMVSGP